MKTVLALASLLASFVASLAAITPAAADAPSAGFGRRAVMAERGPAFRAPRMRRYGYAPRHRHHYGHGGYRVAGPSLGPLPPFFEGMGDGAAHLEGAPVGLTLYREAYIGRGLIYNTPPTLDRPASVLSVRY